MRIDLVNHRGSFCIYKTNLLCQEGVCSGCAILEEFQRKTDELIDELWGDDDDRTPVKPK